MLRQISLLSMIHLFYIYITMIFRLYPFHIWCYQHLLHSMHLYNVESTELDQNELLNHKYYPLVFCILQITSRKRDHKCHDIQNVQYHLNAIINAVTSTMFRKNLNNYVYKCAECTILAFDSNYLNNHSLHRIHSEKCSNSVKTS